jgi:hypothetical protein
MYYFSTIVAVKAVATVMLIGYLTYSYKRACKYEPDMAPSTKSTLFFNQLIDNISDNLAAVFEKRASREGNENRVSPDTCFE